MSDAQTDEKLVYHWQDINDDSPYWVYSPGGQRVCCCWEQEWAERIVAVLNEQQQRQARAGGRDE